jgi:hypothetical protein
LRGFATTGWQIAVERSRFWLFKGFGYPHPRLHRNHTCVRCPGITDALHVLEGDKLIRSVRGKVIILDRKGLMLKANGSYGIQEAEYKRLMGRDEG